MSGEYSSEDEVYDVVDTVLAEECLLLDHHWTSGELLFVDNRVTVHGRSAFVGERQMVRIRYDDPVATGITY